MSSMFKKITDFAGSPQGKKLTDKVQKIKSDPKTRAKIDNARRKLEERRGRSGGAPPRA